MYINEKNNNLDFTVGNFFEVLENDFKGKIVYWTGLDGKEIKKEDRLTDHLVFFSLNKLDESYAITGDAFVDQHLNGRVRVSWDSTKIVDEETLAIWRN